jgi:hypothetical protein
VCLPLWLLWHNCVGRGIDGGYCGIIASLIFVIAISQTGSVIAKLASMSLAGHSVNTNARTCRVTADTFLQCAMWRNIAVSGRKQYVSLILGTRLGVPLPECGETLLVLSVHACSAKFGRSLLYQCESLIATDMLPRPGPHK